VTSEPDPQPPEPAAAAPALQLMLWVTRAAPGHGAWHAQLRLPDHSVLDFASPFELARYLSAPPPGFVERRRSGGLR
jgi:hypothetical protein